MIPRQTLLLIACASLFALATAVPAAAGSTPPDTPPPGADVLLDAAFDYAQCLRDNGIDDYPDPRTEGGGLEITSPLDLNTHTNEEVAAAQAACEPILAAARPPPSSEPDDAGGDGGGPSEWEAITPGGDCECADGSEFTFWDRDADPTRVVLYLDGGGACTDALTCAFTGSSGESDFYNWNIGGKDPEFPGRGILDLDHADNPFADPNAGRALESLGLDGTTLENIDANDAAIEAAGVDLHTFTAAGDGHRVLERDDFYVLEEGGVTLVEWISALLAGDPLDDVRCVDCAAPS